MSQKPFKPPADDKLTLKVAGGTLQDVGGGPEVERRQPSAERTIEFATPRAKLIEEADRSIRGDLAPHPKALAAYDALSKDPEALASWDMANYLTMRKLGYNDHGRVHAWVTGAASLAILDLLVLGGVQPDLVESGIGDLDDAYVAVILGTMLHDIGNQVHRVQHELHGAMLARPILDRLLTPLYPDVFKRTKVRAFALHCIDCHDLNPVPLTIEGGVTAVADGIDITKGRGRKAFALGSVDIHSISALAVDFVTIARGREKPVSIEVTMNNSGGIFQVEEILAPKLIRSPLAPYVSLRATLRDAPEERILNRVRLEGDHFVMDLENFGEVKADVDVTRQQLLKEVERELGGQILGEPKPE